TVLDNGRGTAARRPGTESGGSNPADGSGTGAPDGGGHGLLGMRERVTALGGALTAGPRYGGGFRVHAILPIEARTGEPEPPGPAAATGERR
ncbi:two-component sensor histidine kinase, partial [Streptomyces sp. SID8455]|nr:two-component sensor histidine kinase [Streptomyces sp. SID8455]